MKDWKVEIRMRGPGENTVFWEVQKALKSTNVEFERIEVKPVEELTKKERIQKAIEAYDNEKTLGDKEELIGGYIEAYGQATGYEAEILEDCVEVLQEKFDDDDAEEEEKNTTETQRKKAVIATTMGEKTYRENLRNAAKRM